MAAVPVTTQARLLRVTVGVTVVVALELLSLSCHPSLICKPTRRKSPIHADYSARPGGGPAGPGPPLSLRLRAGSLAA
jgi:hypothetical protein